ncbi:hypothetical protein [Afifella sp. IM 167]|uniref:hypothetical protein n=1 Tax=Afifella sp. IM 167 TaxID=2033586 RepID=UPI001CCB5A3E|nr:hypothetical protein [Afifella sp. IM 167]MBZ8134198.1 hypothetical protein [Afifella sp. IM 167]
MTRPARKPLFETPTALWRGFLVLNLFLVPAAAILASLAGTVGGPGLSFILGFIVALFGIIANFAIWLSARRLKIPQHWVVPSWIVLCLATTVVAGAASPVALVLGLVFDGFVPGQA